MERRRFLIPREAAGTPDDRWLEISRRGNIADVIYGPLGSMRFIHSYDVSGKVYFMEGGRIAIYPQCAVNESGIETIKPRIFYIDPEGYETIGGSRYSVAEECVAEVLERESDSSAEMRPGERFHIPRALDEAGNDKALLVGREGGKLMLEYGNEKYMMTQDTTPLVFIDRGRVAVDSNDMSVYYAERHPSTRDFPVMMNGRMDWVQFYCAYHRAD